ncbi:MerR family transcriptional regulator [Gluconobacter potus]|uniref:MerR family transcriptional regulator n=1 Tax=Gluconobacter potus TaxID=2724927 RepID=UPI0039EC45BF
MTDNSTSQVVMVSPNDDLASAPEKVRKAPEAYRTISEVAEELHIPQHRLRSWETIYPGVKPFRGESGRRYYSPEHIETLRLISDLLYVQGYKGQGVLRVLRERRAEKARAAAQKAAPEAVPETVQEVSAASAEAVYVPVVTVEATEESPAPVVDATPVAEPVENEDTPVTPTEASVDDIVFPEIPAAAHEVVVTETVDSTAENESPEAEAEAPDSALLVTLRDENELLFNTLEKTEAENSLLRSELREILEELRNLRNLLPV